MGEVPATIEYALEKEKPDVTYVICSEYQLNKVASDAGYTEPNEIVVKRAAAKFDTKVVFKLCDVFDPGDVCSAISGVTRELKPTDEVVVNYTGGAANVKLFLGTMAVALASFLNVRIIYAIRYKDGFEVFKDQTAELREIFKRLYDFL